METAGGLQLSDYRGWIPGPARVRPLKALPLSSYQGRRGSEDGAAFEVLPVLDLVTIGDAPLVSREHWAFRDGVAFD